MRTSANTGPTCIRAKINSSRISGVQKRSFKKGVLGCNCPVFPGAFLFVSGTERDERSLHKVPGPCSQVRPFLLAELKNDTPRNLDMKCLIRNAFSERPKKGTARRGQPKFWHKLSCRQSWHSLLNFFISDTKRGISGLNRVRIWSKSAPNQVTGGRCWEGVRARGVP